MHVGTVDAGIVRFIREGKTLTAPSGAEGYVMSAVSERISAMHAASVAAERKRYREALERVAGMAQPDDAQLAELVALAKGLQRADKMTNDLDLVKKVIGARKDLETAKVYKAEQAPLSEPALKRRDKLIEERKRIEEKILEEQTILNTVSTADRAVHSHKMNLIECELAVTKALGLEFVIPA